MSSWAEAIEPRERAARMSAAARWAVRTEVGFFITEGSYIRGGGRDSSINLGIMEFFEDGGF